MSAGRLLRAAAIAGNSGENFYTSLKLKIAREGERVELAPVGATVIVAAAADGHKTGASIHFNRWISFAHLEMNAASAVRSSAVDEIVKQAASNATAAMFGADGQQQQF